MKTLTESLLDDEDVLVDKTSIKELIIEWLNKYEIENYKINDDFTIDVDGDLFLQDYHESQLPDYIQFNKVNGDTMIRFGNFINFYNFPKIITGELECDYCDALTSFEGTIKSVKTIILYKCDSIKNFDKAFNIKCKNFYIKKCKKLKSLIGIPKSIDGFFECSDCNSLKNLKGSPKKINLFFRCDNCEKLESLEGAPEFVGGNFSCIGCEKLKTLKGSPKKVGCDFDCSWCEKLESLEGAPEIIEGNFDCSFCDSLKSLKGKPKIIKGKFICKKL